MRHDESSDEAYVPIDSDSRVKLVVGMQVVVVAVVVVGFWIYEVG